IPVERLPERAAPVQRGDPEGPGAVLVDLRGLGGLGDQCRNSLARLGVERVDWDLAVATAVCVHLRLRLHLLSSSSDVCVITVVAVYHTLVYVSTPSAQERFLPATQLGA